MEYAKQVLAIVGILSIFLASFFAAGSLYKQATKESENNRILAEGVRALCPNDGVVFERASETEKRFLIIRCQNGTDIVFPK